MPIIPQTLNINNLRTTSAKSINLHTIRKLIEYSLKNVPVRQCLLLPLWRYCYPNVVRYHQRHSGVQGVKELINIFGIGNIPDDIKMHEGPSLP